MLAIMAASAWAFVNTSARCWGVPAPPDATTGIETFSAIFAVRVSSYPCFVPSASTLFTTISPTPRSCALCAHSSASMPVLSRKPRIVIS